MLPAYITFTCCLSLFYDFYHFITIDDVTISLIHQHSQLFFSIWPIIFFLFFFFTISQLSTMSPFYHLFNLTTPPFLLANIIEFIISPVSILSHAPISLFLLFHFFAISSNSSLSRFTSCIHQHSNICPAPCDFTISSSWYFTRTHHISILLGRFYHSDNKPSHSSLQMLSISRHTVLYKSFGPP